MPNWGAVFDWYTYNKTNATKVIRIVARKADGRALVMYRRASPPPVRSIASNVAAAARLC